MKNGFTLVELLVVIVIIGILASVSTASFRGHFAEARNAKRESIVKDYLEALKRYFVQNESYPVPSDQLLAGNLILDRSVCLGDYENDECGYDFGGGTLSVPESVALNNAIEPHLETLPAMSDVNTVFSNPFYGLLYQCYDGNGNCYPNCEVSRCAAGYEIQWAMEGEDDECLGVSDIEVNTNGSTFCVVRHIH